MRRHLQATTGRPTAASHPGRARSSATRAPPLLVDAAAMKSPRTAQQNKEWWLARAAEYSREAAKHITAGRAEHWQQKAAAALAKAESYTLSPTT